MTISTKIRISILEESLTDQQSVVDHKEAVLAAVRARIERGGPETEQEKFQRLSYERNNLLEEKQNLERKWQDCEGAVSDRYL